MGLSPLNLDGKLHSEAKDEARVLNKQFKYVFTPPQSPDAEITNLTSPQTPLISPLVIKVKRVEIISRT